MILSLIQIRVKKIISRTTNPNGINLMLMVLIGSNADMK